MLPDLETRSQKGLQLLVSFGGLYTSVSRILVKVLSLCQKFLVGPI